MLLRKLREIADATRRLEAPSIVGNHERDFKLIQPLGRHRQANQTPAVLRMKLRASGLIFAAAMVRSPSFSRSSSSATTGLSRTIISLRNDCLSRGVRKPLVCRRGPRVAGRSKVLGPPPKESPVTFSTGGENRALQPDILIVLSADSKRGNEYSSEFNVENTTGGARVPGPFVRHRVLAGAGR